MNNMLNTSGSPTSPYMPSLNVSMWVEEEISPEGDHHMTQQLQLCSSYYSNCSPNSSSFNCPQNQQYFDLSYPQATSSNQLPQPLNNYASQYQVQMPLAPDNEYSNQLGLELGYRPFHPSTEPSWALAQFFKSRERYYAFGNQPPRCQAEECNADLTSAKRYHKRHKVCEFHSKAAFVHLGGGIMQRFCQQCSRFHMLDEFDDSKKSCRRRLADHNLRRRKPKPHFPVPSNSDTPMNSTETVSLEQINVLNATNAETSTAGRLRASISSSLSASHETTVISGPSSGAQLNSIDSTAQSNCVHI